MFIKWKYYSQQTSARKKLVKTDLDTGEAPVDEDINRWSDTDNDTPSPDSIHQSSISFKPKEPTLSMVVDIRTTKIDNRLVLPTPKKGDGRAGWWHYNINNISLKTFEVETDLEVIY